MEETKQVNRQKGLCCSKLIGTAGWGGRCTGAIKGVPSLRAGEGGVAKQSASRLAGGGAFGVGQDAKGLPDSDDDVWKAMCFVYLYNIMTQKRLQVSGRQLRTSSSGS